MLRSYGHYYYEVNAEAAKNLLITLGNRNTNVQLPDEQRIQILVSKDKLPSEDNHEHLAQSSRTQLFTEIPIAPSSAGKYYVLIITPYIPSDSVLTTIQANYVTFHLSGISPNKASNVGSLTSQIKGTDLGVDTGVTLIGPGGELITGTDLLSASQTSVFATFNLQGAAVGNYTLQVKRATDGAVRTLTNAVEVAQGTGGRLKIEIVGPEVVRPGRSYEYKLVYQNIGDADLQAPFVYVTISGTGRIAYAGETQTTTRLAWLAVAPGSLGEELSPGQGGTIAFQAALDANAQLITGSIQEDDALFDWASLEPKLTPEDLSETERRTYWNTITTEFGTTNRQVLASLRILNRYHGESTTFENLLRLALSMVEPTTGTNQMHGQAVIPKIISGVVGACAAQMALPYDATQDVGLYNLNTEAFIIKPPVLDMNKPAIIITHGWNARASDTMFKELAKQLLEKHDDYNIVLVDWDEGAKSIPYVCPWAASKRIPSAAREAVEKLKNLGYTKWDQTIYIGHSFGNGVNAAMSKAAPQPNKGTALLLNAANPAGYGKGAAPHYKQDFDKVIAIQTADIADDHDNIGQRTIHFKNPLCHGKPCSTKKGEAHSAAFKLITCLLGGQDQDTENCFTDSAKVDRVRTNPQLAGWLIKNEWNNIPLVQNLLAVNGCLNAEGFFFIIAPSLSGGDACTIPDLYYFTPDIFWTFVPQDQQDVTVVRSSDPNDKVGPAGYGDMHLVPVDETLQYTVNFENQRTATAPVQELVVTDDLDPNLDWATLQFSEIAYGDRVLAIPEGSQSFSIRDYPPSSAVVGTAQGELAIDINGSLNPTTGKITWHLRLIDTATGTFPEDPLAGFLMPEDGTGRGQGHVSFSIRPKSNISLGTRIANKATIVFDTNDPITTNEVWNTIGAVVDVALTQIASAETVSAGEQITLTVRAYNDGANPANNVVVTDTLPQGLSLVSATASQGSCSGTETAACSLGTLAPGDSATITIVATATASGSFTNIASATSNDIERNEINNSASVRITVTNQPKHLTFIPLIAR